jgi:uncharacterized membrane protein
MNDEIKQYLHAGKKNLIAIYILFLCGMVIPVLPVIGVIIAYINKDVKDTFLSSHYIFIIRTFCIAFIGLLVSMITMFIFIGPVLYFIVWAWSVARIVTGLKYLSDNTGHTNPMTYWIK